jgi:MFS family permease
MRAEIYAWYSLIGTSGAALGILSCGWLVHHLHHDLKWEHLAAYQLIFYVYAGIGVLKVILALSQSSAVEADKPETTESDAQTPTPNQETEPLLGDRQPEQTAAADTARPQPKKPWIRKPALPKISPQSRSVIASLCVLFALDSFASGLAPL